MKPTPCARALAVILASLLPAANAAAEIVRCAEPGGGVTYQEVPCSASSVEHRLSIPAEFPAPNYAERDRIFAREAALDRRLEARRDREVQETAIRAQREDREAEQLALLDSQAPLYGVGYPIYGRPRPFPPRHPHPSPRATAHPLVR